MKFGTVLILIFIILPASYFAQDVEEKYNADSCAAMVLHFLKDVQKELPAKKISEIVSDNLPEKVEYMFEDCGITYAHSYLPKGSDSLQTIMEVISYARFARIWVTNKDTIRISIWPSGESFTEQELAIEKSNLTEENIYMSLPADMDYGTGWGFSILVAIRDSKIIIYKLVKANSC